MAITNGYANLSEVKAALQISDTTDDTRLEICIESACRMIDEFCARRFWQDSTATARYYTPLDREQVVVDDISTTTGLIVATDTGGDYGYATTLTINTDFLLEPANAEAATPLEPYTRIIAIRSGRFPQRYRSVKVTAKFGFAAVPTAVRQAAIIQSERIFKDHDAPFGVAGDASFGAPMRLLSKLHPDAEMALRYYKKLLVA